MPNLCDVAECDLLQSLPRRFVSGVTCRDHQGPLREGRRGIQQRAGDSRHVDGRNRVLLAKKERLRRKLRVHAARADTDIVAEPAFGPQRRPANVVRDAAPAAPRPPAERREHVTADVAQPRAERRERVMRT